MRHIDFSYISGDMLEHLKQEYDQIKRFLPWANVFLIIFSLDIQSPGVIRITFHVSIEYYYEDLHDFNYAFSRSISERKSGCFSFFPVSRQFACRVDWSKEKNRETIATLDIVNRFSLYSPDRCNEFENEMMKLDRIYSLRLQHLFYYLWSQRRTKEIAILLSSEYAMLQHYSIHQPYPSHTKHFLI